MENTQRETYSTDLREAEWAVMEALLGGPLKLGRPPRYDRREVFNAIFYIIRTGGSWHFLPNDLPPWRIVYYYYTRWREEGLWQKFHDALREVAREKNGKKKPQPLRYWIARACGQLAREECAATMRERRSWDEPSGTR